MTTTIAIKNMVCPRCVRVVAEELDGLGLTVEQVTLGIARVSEGEAAIDWERLRDTLTAAGFDLVRDREEQMVEHVKVALIDYVGDLEAGRPPLKVSAYLGDRLGASYPHLSKTFSRLEGHTIEQHLIRLRIERVKELLEYGELSLAEIADRLGYSSVQHLSAQFKRTAGVTVSEYRRSPQPHRHFLDDLG